jgi:hypothetical protein
MASIKEKPYYGLTPVPRASDTGAPNVAQSVQAREASLEASKRRHAEHEAIRKEAEIRATADAIKDNMLHRRFPLNASCVVSVSDDPSVESAITIWPLPRMTIEEAVRRGILNIWGVNQGAVQAALAVKDGPLGIPHSNFDEWGLPAR